MFSIGFVKSLIFQLFVSQNIMVKYLNPSFLVKIPTGGYCLVTTFPKVGYFSIKPQPSLMPDHQTLQLVPDSISPQSMYPDRQEALHTGLTKNCATGSFQQVPVSQSSFNCELVSFSCCEKHVQICDPSV